MFFFSEHLLEFSNTCVMSNIHSYDTTKINKKTSSPLYEIREFTQYEPLENLSNKFPYCGWYAGGLLLPMVVLYSETSGS